MTAIDLRSKDQFHRPCRLIGMSVNACLVQNTAKSRPIKPHSKDVGIDRKNSFDLKKPL